MPVTLTMTLPDQALLPFQTLLVANFQSLTAQLQMMEETAGKITDLKEKEDFDDYGKLLGVQLSVVAGLLQNFPKPPKPEEQSRIVGLDGRPVDEPKKLLIPG